MIRIKSFLDYQNQYKFAKENPEQFWSEVASGFRWRAKWSKVLDYNFEEPKINWFVDAKLNITENCLDRHTQSLINQGSNIDSSGVSPDKIALIWEPNDPSDKHKTYTYLELQKEVCRRAAALQKMGVQKGDRICLYMPMIPDLLMFVLASARIGAIHSVVFGGFSAQSLADRINDVGAKVLITSDGAFRGEKTIDIKKIADQAVANCPCIDQVLVCRYTGQEIDIQAGRDIFLEDALKDCPDYIEPTYVDSEDPLFILYTSGSTGKPKGVVHSSAGYMVYAQYSFENVFDYRPEDIHFCTADIGWITGHTYLIYGPLLAGATTIMFEGVPTYPTPDRFWNIIEKHKISIFYTAPTAIRMLMNCPDSHIQNCDLSSLRVLGTVGEPINHEAWEWYNNVVGKNKCPIVDTWWQTETGGILISPLAGITPTRPTFATLPLPGISPIIVDQDGKVIENIDQAAIEIHTESDQEDPKNTQNPKSDYSVYKNIKNSVQELQDSDGSVEGSLCFDFPFPGMIRTTWGDHGRCKQTYFSGYPKMYFSGDGARREKDGYYRILGRVDDVINVSGHRFGTAEIENAIDENVWVNESAVVGYSHPVKGQAIYAFVVLENDGYEETDKGVSSNQTTNSGGDEQTIIDSIQKTVTEIIGPIARPDKIQIVKGLPKTRSGKIMRRILRKIAEGETQNLGDTSTLLDPSVVEDILKG